MMSSHCACIRQRPWFDMHSSGYFSARGLERRSLWLSPFSIQCATGGRSGSSGACRASSVEQYSSLPVGVVSG